MSITSNIMGYINAAASQFGVSSDYLARVAQIESHGDPNAASPLSNARGLFQFIPSTAALFGLKNRFDPEASSYAAADLTAQNQKSLTRSLGRAPTYGELYLAHQQGARGAEKLLNNPEELAVNVVGRKAVLNNGGHMDMTAGQFASLWTSKFSSLATKGASVLLASNPIQRRHP